MDKLIEFLATEVEFELADSPLPEKHYKENGEWYFRYYEARNYNGRVYLGLETFPVIKRTEKGAWIGGYWKKRFVLDGEGKRFAYPTYKQAIESYLARKERQLLILKGQLERAKAGRELGDKEKDKLRIEEEKGEGEENG